MKNKLLLALWLLLLGSISALQAQLTLKVTAIPVNTPAGATIYVAGNFNNWNAADATKTLTKNGTEYTIVLNPTPGTVEFKFTRGGWPSVEGNANGTYLPNRTFNYTGAPQTVNLTILSWEDLGGGGNNNSTAAPNVVVMNTSFYMPELNRNRRIIMYLPPDYANSNKSYPVLYMHDAQNLFDAATAFGGNEWKVDESLNTLFQQGDYGCIVVGIDNSAYRLDEYSPWINPDYGGGQGDEYVDFLVNTLKPYIDANYRTLPGRNTTGIMGSSMGALISMYGFSERQDIFSKVGVFSPAFWFAGTEPANHVATHPKQGAARVYLLAGGDEPAYVATDMQTVSTAMTTAGFGANERFYTVVPGGQHSEWFWAQEFPDAYVWLFQGAVSSTQSGGTKPAKVEIFPNPAGSWIRFAGVDSNSKIRIKVMSAEGALRRDTTQNAGEAFWTGDLPAGMYIVKVKPVGGVWQTVKMVKD
jgi:predicted alpha/beta superfamily hydrolase